MFFKKNLHRCKKKGGVEGENSGLLAVHLTPYNQTYSKLDLIDVLHEVSKFQV